MVQAQGVGSVASSIPDIIREAAKSPLGLVALVIVVVGAAGLMFFYKEHPGYRLAVFIVLFAGATAFSYQLMSTQRELTNERLSAAWQDSLKLARQNPQIAEFSVQLQFPQGVAIPTAVESLIQKRGQRSFAGLDSQSFQRSDDPASNSVSIKYFDLPSGAVLKVVAREGVKKWVAPDIRVPETHLRMTQK